MSSVAKPLTLSFPNEDRFPHSISSVVLLSIHNSIMLVSTVDVGTVAVITFNRHRAKRKVIIEMTPKYSGGFRVCAP